MYNILEIISIILTIIIIAEHLYIVWMEMFAWETLGKKTFGNSLQAELFIPTKKLAANQGLYNFFLAAGLILSFLISDAIWSNNVRLFFLACISVAGIYGALTASRKIFFVQALPAIICIILLFLIK